MPDELNFAEAEIVEGPGATAPAPSTAIVKRESQDIFARFDGLDDDVIVAELEGRLVDTAVYHFNQDGKELWGIGKVGVDWCANELTKQGYVLRDEDVEHSIDPTDPAYVLLKAKVGLFLVAKDGAEARVSTAIGTKRQSVKLRKRDGSTVPDGFWYEKGSQKALRNARLRLIPEEVKAMIIARAKEGGKVRVVTDRELPPVTRAVGRPAATPPPPPATTNRAEYDKVIGIIDAALGRDSIDPADFTKWLYAGQAARQKKYAAYDKPGGHLTRHMGNLDDLRTLAANMPAAIVSYRAARGAK